MFMEKIWIDTDLGSDCDDVGAFSLLHNLAKEGKAEIIGCTYCSSEMNGAIAIKAINEWYGKKNLPIGRFTKYPFLEEEICKRYTSKIAANYLKEHSMPEFEDATKTLRRMLAEQRDVVLVTIGMFNNIAELLRSGPDEISEKTGIELCKDSVKQMYSMGGHFLDTSYSEYNIKCDIENASYVAENFPKPITYIGFEIGEQIFTGKNLAQADESCPMKIAYDVFKGRRESWDPITVYCAICADSNLFKKQENVTILFDFEGKTIIKKGGKDSYMMLNADVNEIEEELERYMRI